MIIIIISTVFVGCGIDRCAFCFGLEQCYECEPGYLLVNDDHSNGIGCERTFF